MSVTPGTFGIPGQWSHDTLAPGSDPYLGAPVSMMKEGGSGSIETTDGNNYFSSRNATDYPQEGLLAETQEGSVIFTKAFGLHGHMARRPPARADVPGALHHTLRQHRAHAHGPDEFDFVCEEGNLAVALCPK